jgi:TatD DNase family protein
MGEYFIEKAQHPKCIAIGETGLDYYRVEDAPSQMQQRQRFINHIEASITTKKPLIIHTRQAAKDTIAVMEDHHADKAGGVMHCFSEDWDIAKAAMDLGFYISLSGILTFKNATLIQDVAKRLPLDRILIETDAPYLAPMPFRGKQNHPALVAHTAKYLAELRNVTLETISEATTQNFSHLFGVVL